MTGYFLCLLGTSFESQRISGLFCKQGIVKQHFPLASGFGFVHILNVKVALFKTLPNPFRTLKKCFTLSLYEKLQNPHFERPKRLPTLSLAVGFA